MAPERRDILHASGGLAALLTGGIAGCTERLDDVTGGIGGPDAPSYADSMYDPAALFDVQTRGFVSVDAAAYREQKAALPEQFRKSVEETDSEVRGVERGDVDRLSGVFGADRGAPGKYADDRSVNSGLATGDFDAAAVTSQVEEENDDLVQRGEYEGYTLYGGASEHDRTRTIAVAVSSEAVIGGSVDVAYPNETPEPEREDGYVDLPELSATPSGVPTAVDAVKAHIDATNGNGDRLASDDTAAQVLSDVGDQPLVAGVLTDGADLRQRFYGDGADGTREPEDELAKQVKSLTQGLTAIAGSAGAPESSSGEVVVWLYYDSSDIASDRAETLRSAVETAKSRSEDVTPPETDVTTEEKAVVLTVSGNPNRLAEEAGFGERGESDRGTAAEREAPRVSFHFDYDPDGPLSITHDGGDTVQGDQIRIVSKDGTLDQRWSESPTDVTAGDSVTVQADSDDVVRVVWIADDGEQSRTLGKWTGPDA